MWRKGERVGERLVRGYHIERETDCPLHKQRTFPSETAQVLDPLSLRKDVQTGPEGKLGGLVGAVLWSKAAGLWTPSSPEEGTGVQPSTPNSGAAFGPSGRETRSPGACPAPAATRAASRGESVAWEANGLRAAGEGWRVGPGLQRRLAAGTGRERKAAPCPQGCGRAIDGRQEPPEGHRGRAGRRPLRSALLPAPASAAAPAGPSIPDSDPCPLTPALVPHPDLLRPLTRILVPRARYWASDPDPLLRPQPSPPPDPRSQTPTAARSPVRSPRGVWGEPGPGQRRLTAQPAPRSGSRW